MPFSAMAKALHWVVAGLIISQYVLIKLAEAAEHNSKTLEQLALLANHKSIGITVLLLAVARLLYRVRHDVPSHPTSMVRWQVVVSNISHIALYGFLFAMPITGWLMSSAKAYSVSWFNLVALPDFIAPNEGLAELLHSVHYYLAEALFVVAVIHVAAAIKHHFIDKDEVLIRMSSRVAYVLFFLTLILSVGVFGRLFDSKSPTLASDGSRPITIESDSDLNDSGLKIVQSDLPLWLIDYDQSYIKFRGDQAGAPFEGEWQKWSAQIQFDEGQLEKARFDVSIDTSSGFSNDKDRDDTIRSVDFFDIKAFPNAYYRASEFSIVDDLYRSKGELSIKGITAESELAFSISKTCLLYTSPSPRDKRQSRMPSSA